MLLHASVELDGLEAPIWINWVDLKGSICIVLKSLGNQKGCGSAGRLH
jgi:hypothetical protein